MGTKRRGVLTTKLKKRNKSKLTLITFSLLLSGAALVLNGCQSNFEDAVTKTHGSTAGDGYTYGTGPNKTKPYPQSEKVNLNNVGGAKPKYEPLSKGGNKDYVVFGQNYTVWTNCHSYLEIGTASWYGPGFHGNKTSNGEVYNQKGFTAAHKNLPLPSYLKVTNLENGRAVVVRVNDRGPFHGSRIIDLSEGAAKTLDMTKKGTAKVKLELIDVRANGIGNLSDSTASGQNIAGGIINSIIQNNTSSKTQNNLQNIGNFISESQNGGKPSLGTTIAAAGSALYIAGQLAKETPNNNNSRSTLAPTNTRAIDNVVAEELAQIKSSTQKYEVNYATPITQTPQMLPGNAYIQLFSSNSEYSANKIQAKLKGRTTYPVLVVAEDGLYRVRIGPVPDTDLNTTLEYIKQLGYADAFIKRIK